jgi:hypothetical protein
MNENWLDEFCHTHTYSIIVREPVARTMSHVHHFLLVIQGVKGVARDWKLSLIQSNYMTWALAAASNIEEEKTPKHFFPDEDGLQIAASRLMQMDYIIDLSYDDQQCKKQMFDFMGIPVEKEMRHTNTRHTTTADYTANYQPKSVALSNDLDIQLYNFATTLLDFDCLFMRLVSEMKEPSEN